MRELLIREERKDERRRVEELTRDAFWDVFKPGCDEHYILHNFRSSPDFIGELSCVATDGGELVGTLLTAAPFWNMRTGRGHTL